MITLRNIIFILVGVAVLGAGGFFLFFSGNKAMPANQLSVFAEFVSKDSDEHELTVAVTARKIAGLFADDCRVGIPAHNISRTYARQDISSAVLSARSRYSSILLKFDEIETDFTDPQTARVVSKAFLEAVWAGGGGIREVYEVVCHLEKFEKKWVFSNVQARLLN